MTIQTPKKKSLYGSCPFMSVLVFRGICKSPIFFAEHHIVFKDKIIFLNLVETYPDMSIYFAITAENFREHFSQKLIDFKKRTNGGPG